MKTFDYKTITMEEVLAKKPSGKKELYKKAHQQYLKDLKFD
jgi:hypothetical protein